MVSRHEKRPMNTSRLGTSRCFMTKHASSPLGNTALSGKRPEGSVTKRKYEPGLNRLYVGLKLIETLLNELVRFGTFRVEEERLDIVARRAVFADIREEA